MVHQRDVAGIALSVLNDKVRFLQKPENSRTTRKRLYPTYPPWEEFMRDVGKVKLTINPQKKTLDKIWNWLSISVAPSLKLFEEIGKLDNQDYIGLLVEQGIMKEYFDNCLEVTKRILDGRKSSAKIYDDYKKFSLMAKKY